MGELVKMEWRKAAAWYLMTLMIILAYVLVRPGVLSGSDLSLMFLAAVQGAVLGWRLFSDAPFTRAFLFSRAPTRRDLFLVRWGLGLGLQALTLLAVAVGLAVGARYLFQAALWNSPYYPMAKWYELAALWPLAIFSFLAYQVAMFLKLRAEVLAAQGRRRWGGAEALTITFGLMVFLAAHMFCVRAGAPVPFPLSIWVGVAWAYVAAVVILSAWASMHCHEKMEIEG